MAIRSETGWLLDICVDAPQVSLWLLTEANRVIKLRDRFHPRLYVSTRTPDEQDSLAYILSQYEQTHSCLKEEKTIGLTGLKEKLLRFDFQSAKGFHAARKTLKRIDVVEAIYNADLLPVQQYITYNLRIPPGSHVNATLDESNKLLGVVEIEEPERIEPPPLKVLNLKVKYGERDGRIASIAVRSQAEEIQLEGSEANQLQSFSEFLERYDPDVLVAPACGKLVKNLLRRADACGAEIHLSREPIPTDSLMEHLPYHTHGRLLLDSSGKACSIDDFGIAGLIERARFSYLPLGYANRWTANRVIDSRNCYNLHQRGCVIPEHGRYEYVRPIARLFQRDRGGSFIPFKVGLHYNVGELDFSSEYANIIAKYGISYENVNPDGWSDVENPLLSETIRQPLERRLFLKKLRKTFPKESLQRLWCEQRQNELKLLLCCAYGTSGCCWNRFGNVLSFEEINLKSREVMRRTRDLIQAEGFGIIGGYVDSFFVQREGARYEDYMRLAERVSEIIALPVSLENHFRFIAIPPLKGIKDMESFKYYGATYDRDIVAKRLELKKSDTPAFIAQTQREMITALFSYGSIKEVLNEGYRDALAVLQSALQDIRARKINPSDLEIRRTLRRSIDDYQVSSPHVTAARQLASEGRPTEGEIGYIYTSATHRNPLLRVAAVYEEQLSPQYDSAKYSKMMLSAAETILTPVQMERSRQGIAGELTDEDHPGLIRLDAYIDNKEVIRWTP